MEQVKFPQVQVSKGGSRVYGRAPTDTAKDSTTPRKVASPSHESNVGSTVSSAKARLAKNPFHLPKDEEVFALRDQERLTRQRVFK